jgi:hypothetical protein
MDFREPVRFQIKDITVERVLHTDFDDNGRLGILAHSECVAHKMGQ